ASLGRRRPGGQCQQEQRRYRRSNPHGLASRENGNDLLTCIISPRDQPQTTPSSLQERKRDCTTRSSEHSVIRVHVVSRDAPLQLGVYGLRVRVLAAKLQPDVKTSRGTGPHHCVPPCVLRRSRVLLHDLLDDQQAGSWVNVCPLADCISR